MDVSTTPEVVLGTSHSKVLCAGQLLSIQLSVTRRPQNTLHWANNTSMN